MIMSHARSSRDDTCRRGGRSLMCTVTTDPVNAAQDGQALVLLGEPIRDKSNACLHLGGLFPRHLRIVGIAADVSPMKSVYLSPIKPVRTRD
jgi:hypothetical protein